MDYSFKCVCASAMLCGSGVCHSASQECCTISPCCEGGYCRVFMVAERKEGEECCRPPTSDPEVAQQPPHQTDGFKAGPQRGIYGRSRLEACTGLFVVTGVSWRNNAAYHKCFCSLMRVVEVGRKLFNTIHTVYTQYYE